MTRLCLVYIIFLHNKSNECFPDRFFMHFPLLLLGQNILPLCIMPNNNAQPFVLYISAVHRDAGSCHVLISFPTSSTFLSTSTTLSIIGIAHKLQWEKKVFIIKAAELLPLVLINRTEIRSTASLSTHWLNCKKLLGSNKFAQLKSFGKEKEPHTEKRTVCAYRLALICFLCPLHETFTITSVVRSKNFLKPIMECHSSGSYCCKSHKGTFSLGGRRYGRTITHLSDYRRPLSRL